MGLNLLRVVKMRVRFIGRGINFLRAVKIRVRLIIAFLLLSIVPLLLLGLLSYNKSSHAIDSKINIYSVQVMDQLSKTISLKMDSFKTYSDEILFSKTIQEGLGEFKNASDTEQYLLSSAISTELGEKLKSTDEIDNAVIITNNDLMLQKGAGGTSTSSYYQNIGLEKISKLKQAAQQGQGSVVWFTDFLAEDHVIHLIRTIHSTSALGEELGYSFIALNEKAVTDIFQNMNLGDKTNTFIVNSAGAVISSKSAEIQVGQPFREAALINKLKDMDGKKKYTFDFQLAKQPNLISYSPIGKLGWYAVSTIPYAYLNSETNGIRNLIIVFAVISFIIATLATLILSQSISAPLKKLIRTMGEAEKGNLAVQIDDQSSDELGEVSQKFNRMLHQIHMLATQVKEASQEVTLHSEQISSSSNQSHYISSQIANTIQHIAVGAAEQSEEAYLGVAQMDQLANVMNQVEIEIGKAAQVIKETGELSQHANQVIVILNDTAINSRDMSQKIILNIQQLNAEMKEIRGIVGLIAEIAKKTNMLALNAAIEAARAGVAGKGFAVVAGEVRVLAEQSKKASFQINGMIENIYKMTETTVEQAIQASSAVQQQMNAVEKADDSFQTIFQAMQDITDQLLNVERSVNEMQTSKEMTVQSIQKIYSVTQEAAAAIQQISASTEEQSAGAESLSALADNLKQMAANLDETVANFTI